MVKKITIALSLAFMFFLNVQAQLINPNFYGQNAWVPTVYRQFDPTLVNPPKDYFPGACTYCAINVPVPAAPDPNAISGGTGFGQLDNQWNNIQASGAKMIRIGGIGFNKYRQPDWVYRWNVEKIKGKNMVPIVEVPVGTPIGGPDPNPTENNFSPTTAANLVTYLNSNPTTYCKYWIIGNELDFINYTTAEIQTKISTFSTAMRAAQNAIDASNPIIIIGPELVDQSKIGALTSTDNILPYIDIFSFHYYPLGDEEVYNANILSPTRANVIGVLTTPMLKPNSISSYSTPLTTRIQTLASTIAGSSYPGVKIAITEANICYGNDVSGGVTYNTDPTNTAGAGGTDNTINGNGANSFIAGQFWAEMMAVSMQNNVEFINFWSVIEGGSGPQNVGYIDDVTGNKKSTYFHFKMIAENFAGNFKMAAPSSSFNIKAFGSQDCNKIAVMVMNQNQSGAPTIVEIKLNSGAIVSSAPVKFNLDFGITKYINVKIRPQETLLIICDRCGNLQQIQSYEINDGLGPIQYYNTNPYVYCDKCAFPKPTLKCSNPDDTGINHFNNQVLHSSITISDSAWIAGTLKVTNGVVLTIQNAETVFSAGAKIEVQPGGKLIIKGSFLHGCNGATWAGLEVKGNNNPSNQITIERSKILDAIISVSIDKSNNFSITESSFSNGTTAIDMNKVKGFTISGNEITAFTYGIKTSKTIISTSLIKGNYFADMQNSILFNDDNHSKLDIQCNTFDHYADYAILSTNTTLKNQGSSTEGAGNKFTSSSTLLNNKFAHNGNSITYYTDPSYPISFVTGGGMNVSAIASLGDGTCNGSGRMLIQEDTETNGTMKQTEFNCVPNPVSSKATFIYSLPEKTSSTEIRITNLLGELVAKYQIAPGSSSIEVDCSNFKNGIYFYSLISDKNVINTKKMVITK